MNPLSRCLAASFLVICAPRVLADSLTFSRAIDIAEQRSPRLGASQLAIESARAASIPAASLPDPKLVAGVDNYPVSGPEAGQLQRDFMTMQKVGVMQEFPNSAKRRARAAVADALVSVATAEWRINQLSVRRDAAMAWLDLYYAQRKQAHLAEWQSESILFQHVVVAQVSAGRGLAADALAPKLEALQLADRSDDLNRDITNARAALRVFVQDAADDPLQGDPPAFPVVARTLQNHLVHHPELKSFDAESEKAEAELTEARSMKHPDWSVELDYARRAPQFGNMVSLQFSVDLPLWSTTRQDPLIAAKRDALARVRDERDAMLRDHQSDLEARLADYEALTRQLTRALEVALPLADQKVSLLMSAYQSGRSELGAVLAARRERIEERLRIDELQRQQALLAARLHYAYGEDAP